MIETMATRQPEITPLKWMALWTDGIFCRGPKLAIGLKEDKHERTQIMFAVSSHAVGQTCTVGFLSEFLGNTNCRIRLKATENMSFYLLISFRQSFPVNLG